MKMGTGTGGDCPDQGLSPFCAGASPHFLSRVEYSSAPKELRETCQTQKDWKSIGKSGQFLPLKGEKVGCRKPTKRPQS